MARRTERTMTIELPSILRSAAAPDVHLAQAMDVLLGCFGFAGFTAFTLHDPWFLFFFAFFAFFARLQDLREELRYASILAPVGLLLGALGITGILPV